MTNERDTSQTPSPVRPAPTPPAAARRPLREHMNKLLAAGLVAAGLVVGVGATIVAAPRDQAVLMQPVAITAMKDDSLVAVKGTVAEIFGNKFVIADGSGRALVETGRRGEGGKLVSAGEALTVQGRFDDGFIRGEMLVRSDGSAETLKPPRHGPKGMLDRMRGPGMDAPRPGGPG